MRSDDVTGVRDELPQSAISPAQDQTDWRLLCSEEIKCRLLYLGTGYCFRDGYSSDFWRYKLQ